LSGWRRDRRDVEEELRDLGLEPRSEAVENDGSHEEGTVESLEPTGTLQEGDEIRVYFYDKAPDEDQGDDEGLVDDLTGNDGEGGQ
jgi:eukaryotic-like serine/threonine-protein kinase